MKSSKKRIIIYRIVVVLLLILTGILYYGYENKKCTIVKKVNKKVINKIVNPNYVFFGDSITNYCDLNKYFHDMPVVNSGICGDKTDDLLDRMEDVYKYNPSKVFILIGINDLMFEDHDDEIAPDIKEIASQIKNKLPYTEIYIESIYPNSEGYYGYVSPDRIKKVNEEIKNICKEEKYTYINLFDKLKNNEEELDKKYTDDGLHINSEGYNVFSEEIQKYLK